MASSEEYVSYLKELDTMIRRADNAIVLYKAAMLVKGKKPKKDAAIKKCERHISSLKRLWVRSRDNVFYKYGTWVSETFSL